MSYHLEPSNTSADGLYAVDDATGDMIASSSPGLRGSTFLVRFEGAAVPKSFALASKADAESLLVVLADLWTRQ